MKETKKLEEATLGAGCFWCVEAIFMELQGIEEVYSGYTGGHSANPMYQEVCSGGSGHAEVARIVFDPTMISFSEILEVFWTTHNPTTLNRQGNDIGTQYRSSIFYHTDEQKLIAEKSMQSFAAQLWSDPITTEISPLGVFYKAENYHQNYFAQHEDEGYCQIVINPKLQKFRKQFSKKLKSINQ